MEQLGEQDAEMIVRQMLSLKQVVHYVFLALLCCNLVNQELYAVDIPKLRFEKAFPKLRLQRPTHAIFMADYHVLVIEQKSGLIKRFRQSPDVSSSTVYLNLGQQVNLKGGNEEGLLGITLDPDFKNNGYFYVYYSASNPRRGVLERYKQDPSNPGRALPESALTLLEVEQPWSNHNGGGLEFGPDGMLYLSLGDGGSGGDPRNHSQNRATLLGNILRLDVRNSTAENPYEIPADNPFIDEEGVRPEIWAYGLRNVWRFCFDEQGRCWGADVGQNAYEEVNIIVSGGNYGWKHREGFHPFKRSKAKYGHKELIDPIFEYAHKEGKSITGGMIYRGQRYPSLQGVYIVADYATKNVWGIREERDSYPNALIATGADGAGSIVSFAEDQQRELYAISFSHGIQKISTVSGK